MKGISYELKYCERCGSLGLRRSQSAASYCQPCGQILVNYSFPAGAIARGVLGRKPTVRPSAPLILKDTVEAMAAGGCRL